MHSKPLIIMVGDIVSDRRKAISTRSFDADQPTAQDVEQITSWLAAAGYAVEVRESVTGFAADPPKHRLDVLVLPLWRGGASRNRTAIVPAICEELGIPYIGGDVFVHSVCQDKSLSKVFVRNAGFIAPAEWHLPTRADIETFKPSLRLSTPFVIKPQYSAASIGIDDASLCWTDAEASARATHLFEVGLGPVLCEEFITGDEVSLCFIEERGRIVARCAVTYLDRAGQYPYRRALMTFDEKAREDDDCKLSIWPEPVPNELWGAAERLVRTLGRIDHMRVDGRFSNKGFTVIELTQDSNLGFTSELVGGFDAIGIRPPAFFELLIQTSLRNQAR